MTLFHYFDKTWRKTSILFVFMLICTVVSAQGQVPLELEVGGLFASGDFFVAIIGGIVLAFAFQLLLTNLSAAIGLNAASTVTSSSHSSGTESGSSGSSMHEKADSVHETMRTISSAFGIWTVVTVSLSLFFASWLAVELAGAVNVLGAVVVALVTWGLFYLISVTLETATAASILSSLASASKELLNSISETTASVFTKSEESRQADTAAAVTAAVKEELFGKIKLNKTISEFLDQIVAEMGPERYREELAELLDHAEVRTYMRENRFDPETTQLIHELKMKPHEFNREKARSVAMRVKEAFSGAKEEMHTEKPRAEKAIDTAMRVGGMSNEEAEATRHRVEDYLRRTGKAELNPEGIKHDFEQLLSEPKAGAQALKARLNAVDRDTVTAVLTQRQDMSPEEAQRTADRVFVIVEDIRDKTHAATETSKAKVEETENKVLDKVEGYLASLDRPSETLEPEAVRHDIEMLFHDPKEGAEALLHRAETLDRQDVVALLESKRGIDREKAERIVDQIMESRDRAVAKLRHMKEEVERRLEQAKQEALHQANEVRKTAATAAWWMFACGVVSAIAAALGGWVGVLT